MSEPDQIEQIVREVFKRLGAGSAGQAPAPTGQQSEAASFWPARLVTRGELVKRLDGLQVLRVAPDAVVTPAARDYLRERGVRLEVGVATSGVLGQRLVLGVAECRFEPANLVQSLKQQGIEIEQLAKSGLTSVIDELADQVVRGGKWGVLVTGESAAALCLANRMMGVRAALGSSVAGVRSALVSIGANLLVLEPEGQGIFMLRQMVREFCSRPAGAGPHKWKERLG
jgi:ribose 5-phosphate isomerase RpiB